MSDAYDPTRKAPSPGSFGRYRLLEEIGRGGMGVVYRAHDTAIGRTVALKIMQGGEEEDLARFQREVKTAAQLSHPNVVPVHDVGIEAGRHYYTMNFVEGPSLAGVLHEKGRLAPLTALRIARDVLLALEAAHAKGIVHRDVKPANVLLSPDSTVAPPESGPPGGHRVLLADFGLAKQTDSSRRLTASGMVLGTLAYMSPEQAAGEDVDARTDLYSVGSVLYEMLTGRTPHSGRTAMELALSLAKDDPPLPRDLVPEIPRPIEAICLKAIAKKPAHRYGSATEMLADIREGLSGGAVVASTAGLLERTRRRWRRHRSGVAVAAVLAFAGAAGIIGWRLRGPGERVADRPPERMEPPVKANSGQTTDRPAVELPKIHPDALPHALAAAEKEKAGDLEGALKAYAQAIRFDPGNALLYRLRALVLMRKRDYAGAITDFNEAIRLDPNDASAFGNRALCKYRTRDTSGSIDDATRAILMDPKGKTAYFNRGLAYLEAWKIAEALKDFDRYVELDPSNPDGYVHRGVARGLAKDHEGAVKDYTEALRLDPKSARACYNRGVSRAALGRPEEALEDFTRALELDPRHFRALEQRAELRISRGEWKSALEDLERALPLAPDAGTEAEVRRKADACRARMGGDPPK